MGDYSFLLILLMIVYIIGVVVVYKIVFKRISIGDNVIIFIEDGGCEIDEVVHKDPEGEFLYTRHHGKFTVQDLFNGSISVRKKGHLDPI